MGHHAQIRTTWGQAVQIGPQAEDDGSGRKRELDVRRSERTIGSSHIAGTVWSVLFTREVADLRTMTTRTGGVSTDATRRIGEHEEAPRSPRRPVALVCSSSSVIM